MISLIFLSAIVAVAFGGNILLTGHGVPLDTPEVAAAKNAHYAAHAEETARHFALGGGTHHGDVVYGGHHAVAAPAVAYAGHHGYAAGHHAIAAPAIVAAPAIAHYAAPEAHTYAVPPAFGLPVVDTPEVAASKVYHAAAHQEAKARNLLGYPVAATGYLADTPDVAAAKVAHAASHHDALARNSPISPDIVYGGLPYGYGHHLLKIHH